MGDRTPRYGLYKPAAGESLRAEGDAFIRGNMDRIEELLYLGAEAHHHTGDSDELTTPGIPSGDIFETGTLPLSTRFYYRVAHVIAAIESPASDPLIIDTPAGAAPPAIPAAVSHAAGGTLVGGNYYYALSAYVGTDEDETAAPNVVYVPVPFVTSTNRIVLTLPALPAGTDGFNVYRRRPATAALVLVDSIDMTGGTPPTTFEDDGGLTEDVSRTQPRVSTIAAVNSIEITPASVPAGASWKLYRSQDPDEWSDTLLASLASGVTSYLDSGIATSSGSPVEEGAGTGTPSKILLTDQTEVQGRLPLSNVSGFPVTVEFGFDGPLIAGPGDGVWVCPYPKATIIDVTLTLGRGKTPAATDVIADLNKGSGLDPTYVSVFTSPTRPKVLVGDQVGAPASPQAASQELVKGDSLSPDLDVAGGGATPTDEDLTMIVLLYAYGFTATTSHTAP